MTLRGDGFRRGVRCVLAEWLRTPIPVDSIRLKVSPPGHIARISHKIWKKCRRHRRNQQSIIPVSVGYEFMLGDGSAAGRACRSGPGAISRILLWAALAALAVPRATFAQDAVGLPEVRVIANTPLAPPSRRAAPRTEAPPARLSAPRQAGDLSRPVRARAVAPAAVPAATAAVDPALIDRDKIPANVQTLPPAISITRHPRTCWMRYRAACPAWRSATRPGTSFSATSTIAALPHRLSSARRRAWPSIRTACGSTKFLATSSTGTSFRKPPSIA